MKFTGSFTRKIHEKLSIGPRELKFARNSMYYYGAGFFSLLCKFALMVILLKNLGTHNYGLLVLAMSAIGMIYGFMDARAHEGIIQFSLKHLARGEKKQVFNAIYSGYIINAIIAIATYFVIYISAPAVAFHIFHQPVEKSFIRIYGAVCLFVPFTVMPESIMLIFEKHSSLNAVTCLNNVLRLVLPVLFLPLGLRGVLAGMIVSHCLIAVTFIYITSRIMFMHIGQHEISFNNLLKTIKTLSPFMWNTFISATLKSLAGYAPFIILGYFAQPTNVSYFKIASSYAGLTAFATNPISPLIFSKLGQLYAENKLTLFYSALLKGRVYLFLASFSASFALMLTARDLIPFLFGADIKQAIPAAYVLLLASILINAYAWLRPYLLAIGKPEVSTLINVVHIVIYLPAAVYGTYNFGMLGTAFSAFVVFTAVVLPLTPWLIRQSFK